MQEEPQGNKGIDPWDMTGPEDGQLRTCKTNVWIQGLKVGIRCSNVNLQKSSEPASGISVPCPFCPSTHTGMVSLVKYLLPVTGMGQGLSKSGHDSYPKRFSTVCTFIPKPTSWQSHTFTKDPVEYRVTLRLQYKPVKKYPWSHHRLGLEP